MTREEEIYNMANTISPNVRKEIDEDYICNDVYDFTIGFICGAKWADKTMIEKACQWWKKYQEDYDLYDAWNGDYVSFKSVIMDFREAMEG